MTGGTCPNGHPIAAGDLFCPTCGAPSGAAPAPPPTESGSPAAPPPPPAEPGPARSAGGGRSPIPWILIGGSLVAIAVALAIVLTRGDGGATTPTGPVSAGVSTSTTTTTAASTTTTTAASTTTSTTTTTLPVTAGDIPADGTWTVLVYAIGDNNLEGALLDDLREMRAVTGEVSDLRFVALADRSDEYTAESLGRLGDWTTAKLIDISGNAFTELDDWGEANLGDAATLIDFMEAAAAHAPADHYALIFWDHGAMTGVGADHSHDDVLEPWEIAAGLEAGLASTGIGTLDIIGFDACLMASIEVASVVAPYASYMIASEEYEPWDGWDYSGFGYLAAVESPTVEGLGTSLVTTYVATSGPDDPKVTLSMLDLRGYPEFAVALRSFTDAALSSLDVSAATIGRRRDLSVRFGSDPDPLNDWFMVDLGQLLSRVGRSDLPVADEARAAAAALDRLVVANATGDASAGARGLSAHFPPAPEHHYPAWYETVGDPVWSDFLDSYFEAGRALPVDRRAQVVRTSPNTTFAFGDGDIEVYAEITEGSMDTVTSAVMWSGVRDADGTVTFYSSDQGLVEGTAAWGYYDLTRLELSDGADVATAFQQITYVLDGEEITFFTITVPLTYRPPVDPANGIYGDPIDVTLKATADLQTEDISIGLYASEFGTVAAFEAEPNGLIFPKVPVRSPDGTVEWVTTIDVGLWADLDNLGVEFVELAPGTPLYTELRVADFGGYTDVFTVQTEVP